jgi:MFS family permease
MNGILRYQAASIPLRLANSGAVIALPLLAVSAVGDVATGGLLVAALMLPSVLAAPIVGAVLDRVRRPRVLFLAAGLVASASYAIAAGLGFLPVPLVFVILAVAGVFAPVFTGGLSSFATDGIANARDAYTQDSLSYTVAGIGGPALVAITAAATSSARIPLVALAVLALVGAVSSLRVVANPRDRPPEPMRTTIWNGLSYLVHHRPIAVVTSSGTISQIGGGALGVIAISLSIQRFDSPAVAAWIVTAFAVGGLAGAIAIAARRWTRRSAVWVMAMGFIATGASLFAVVPDTSIAFVLVVVGIAGVFTAPANAAMLLLRNQQSKPSVRSQVFTIGAGLRSTAAAVGAAVAGVAAGVDVAWLVAGMAAFWVLAGAILVLYPRSE